MPSSLSLNLSFIPSCFVTDSLLVVTSVPRHKKGRGQLPRCISPKTHLTYDLHDRLAQCPTRTTCCQLPANEITYNRCTSARSVKSCFLVVFSPYLILRSGS